ncbi:BspA family leucine-rich repeat surface protein [[Mycoplasma] testudinis]|uniref:BspA family leucine-rich repeat surface protein n=1 Tax=[Mycoplasma] testudinis TaxID=33924 RepID=UPI000485581D|nr:BspA family leucine-rich repeat surface protein [[Mycoplasma] testudinis]
MQLTRGSLFKKVIKFKQPIVNRDVSKVTEMTNMFFRSKKFNQKIDNRKLNNKILTVDLFIFIF